MKATRLIIQKPENCMKSTFKIIWSKRAFDNLGKIINYLNENWTEKEVHVFSVELERCINIIEKSPDTFPNSNLKPSIRKVVINKQNTLYYRIEGNIVKLINIFDTRQNPKKIKNWER